MAGQTRGDTPIRIEGLSKKYGQFAAVDNVSLSIQGGEFVSLLGPSGSGKTTLLMLIAGFEEETSGSIVVGDEDITSKPSHQRNIGVVFQQYALFPHMSVFDNIAYPLRMRWIPSEQIHARVRDALELVELTGFERRMPAQLSGGQQQRVALARALIFRPSVLLLDEPLAALDKKLRETMQLEIKRIQQALNITTITVTHDQQEALAMSDRVAVMNRGVIEQVGRPRDLYERPSSVFVAGFVGETNLFEVANVTKSGNGSWCRISDELGIFVPSITALPARGLALSLRPEKVRIVPNEGSINNTEEVNAVRGTVEEYTFCGDSCRYSVRVGRSVAFIVKEYAVQGLPARQTGDAVRLEWRTEDVIVLEQP